MIDFPASPNFGQQFTAAGVTWTWDGFKWAPNGIAQPYLPLAGGVMTGIATLSGNPVGNLDAATKQYVDGKSLVAHTNRIINGDMRIDQRNNGASGTAIGYTVDRWAYSATQAGKGTWQRALGVGNRSFGLPYALKFTSPSAYVALATDIFQFYQAIEADMISDFAWGTTGAQPVTLSFWVNSSFTGTFGGSINSYGSARSYPFTYSLPTTGWTKIVIAIPGDTGGPWVNEGSVGAAYVHFDLGSGSNYLGPAGAWASGNFTSATGAASIVGTNGAIFYLTGVKLEIGSVATPFDRKSLAESQSDCERYYEFWSGAGLFMAQNSGGSWSVNMPFRTLKRAAPTIAGITGSPSNPTIGGIGTAGFNASFATGTNLLSWNATAEL